MKTKFMGVAAALTAALALVFGVVVPGALPALQMPTAQAQTTTIPVTPEKRDFSNLNARPDPTFEFTIGADGTITSLDFSASGQNHVQGYTLTINGQSIAPQITPSGTPRQNFTITHNGLNITVKKGDIVRLTPNFTAPKVSGSVSVALRGTTSTTPDPKPGDPNPPVTTVTPAAPTAVDPAKATQCVEKGYINIPNTTGVEYYIDGQLKPSGQQFYEGKTAGSVKVTAKAKAGYQIASGAQTEWPFDFSGQVKDCSGNQPIPPGDSSREFKATGHDFSLQGNPVDPRKPDTFTAKVGEDSRMKYATVRIKTDASFLDWQHYQLTVDKIEDGVTLQKSNLNIGDGYITMEVVPVKDGKQVDSAFLPKDAVFTFTNNLSENKQLSVELDVYGPKATAPEEPPIISPPDGAKWVHGRVANPQPPLRCGLRIAVVADLSTSLRYADTDGFEASKKAANAFIDSLQGTPAELGIYNFASSGPANQAGTTHGQNPPYISMQSEQGVQRAKDVVKNWSYNANNSATNWEAGLKQVKDHDYDVVYFITDGMPTTSSTIKGKGIGGEFVQASALNDAIKAANELKAAGTRVVPIMVDLTLGGNTGKDWVVEQDYVLKDIKRIDLNAEVPQDTGVYYRVNSGIQGARQANYNDKERKGTNESGELIMANLEKAAKLAPNQALQVFERLPNGKQSAVTSDMSRWTYGTRGVKTMGEDISGTGDTVRVEGYGKLANQMKSIAQSINERCNGAVTVKKRIVDEGGNVLSDGEPGWEFTLSAGGKDVIDPGNGQRVRNSLKVTSSAERDRGTATWNIMSEQKQQLELVETQKKGYSLFKRDGKNAVCTEKRDGKTTPLAVENNGEFGFKVNMNEQNKVLSSVFCVVDNYKAPETTPGKLTFKKAQYVDGEIQELAGLGGATFEIYPSKEGKPDYSAGKPVYTIKPGQESIEVKTTGTFFLVETKAPQGLNLLPQPVPFEISVDQTTKKYKISTVGSNNGQIQVSGSGQTMILTVADTKSGELPKTGGYGVGLVGLIGAALAGAGLIFGRRRFA